MPRITDLIGKLLRCGDIIALLGCIAMFFVFERLYSTWTYFLVSDAKIILYTCGALLVAAYILIRFFRFGTESQRQTRSAVLLLLLVLGIPGFITGHQIWVRAAQHPYFIHDGALQNEAAYDATLRGENPYAITYENTFPEGNWRQVHVGELFVLNPAITHYIYLPATFLIDGVIGKAELALFGFRDSRILFFMCYAACVFMLWALVRDHRYAHTLMIAFGLNPFMLNFLAEGRNDSMLLALLIGAFILLFRKRWLWAGILFGVACATKQFAWLFLPALIAFFVFRMHKQKDGASIWKFWAPTVLVAVAFILPFFIWSPNAFIDDVLSYPAGSSPTLNYPISGYGFSKLLTLGGFPPDAYFPFWIPTIIIGLIVGYATVRAIYRSGAVSSIIIAGTVLLVSTVLVSRVVQDSYIVFFLDLFAVGFAFFVFERRVQRAILTTTHESL